MSDMLRRAHVCVDAKPSHSRCIRNESSDSGVQCYFLLFDFFFVVAVVFAAVS